MATREGIALCKHQTGVELGSALCRVDLDSEGKLPKRVQLFGPEPHVIARDGRHWLKTDPSRLVTAFVADRRDLPIDLEHATEIKGPLGEPAPAVGWMTAIEVDDDGSVYAVVEWNDDGKEMLGGRKYRYISPAFRYDIETREILQLTSAGLTNNPALYLTELAREQAQDESMDKELLKMLGLAETASAEDARKALKALQEANTKAAGELTQAQTQLSQAQGDLATARQNTAAALKDMVPRSDLVSALARAETAEAKVKETEAAAFKTQVDTAIAQAMKDGKIAPAQEAFYRGVCTDAKGLASFQAFASQSPAIISDKQQTPPPGTPPSQSSLPEPTAEELAVAARCGIDAEQFKKERQAVFAQVQSVQGA